MGIDGTAPLGKLEDFTPPRIRGAERYWLARYLSARDSMGARASDWAR
ncbi:MAG TPA: hypothetical protein VK066_13190 [Chloroflexota bacterium]|nr:hypothetical protein [Chloroflexota bacterium]